MTLQSKQVQPFVLNPSILHETCPHSCCRIFVGFLAKTCATTPGCFLFICQPTEIAGMLRVLERTQALCKSFWARNQIKMKFLQHFLSSCVVFICACLYLCVSSASLEYTTDRQSCNTISEFKGTDFGRRRRFLLRRFCILQIIGPRSHLDSMWSLFARDTSDKAKEPRRVARAKDMENFIEELHTGPWHTELRTECTQGWSRSNQQRALTNRSSISWWMERNLNSTQVLHSIMCREQFSMTKAVHGTAWNTSAAGLQVLRTRLGCSDLSHNWA